MINQIKRMFNKSIPDGCIGTGASSQDFLLGSILNLEDELKKLEKSDKKIRQWNQYKYSYSKMMCTLVAPISTLASYFNRPISDDEMKQFWDFAVEKYGYKLGKGNFLLTGLKCTQNFWNNVLCPEYPVFYTRYDLTNTKLLSIVGEYNIGSIVCYRGNQAYNQDKADRLLQGVEFGTPTYGHCTTLYNERIIVDSNKGEFDEQYKIYPDHLQKLIENNVYDKDAYVFLPVHAKRKLESRKIKLAEYLLSIKKQRKGMKN